MKQRKKILSGVPRWLWIVIVLLFLITFALPAILTLPGRIDFSETGQIGDTIGGIMSPFIAMIVALLTFIAFWVQYEANIKQREDIAVERQEAKYYKMLDIYSAMTNNLDVHGVKGKEAFAELVGEFTYTFFTIDEIYKKYISNENSLVNKSNQIKGLVADFNQNPNQYDAFITNLSYNLFYYGKHYVIVDLEHPEKTAIGEEIKKIAFRYNRNDGQGSFSDYVKSTYFKVQIPNEGLSYPLYEGHSDFLGHYFRHLFQMVKYVSSLDESIFDEETKCSYVKLLRSQMSVYEQILLYYNSLTEQGSAWNKSKGERFPEDAGFISRFRMIKNLPPNFPLFGVLPFDLYKDDVEKWKKLGKSFYENRHIPISKRVLDTKIE